MAKMNDSSPPVIDYEGSDYQQTFWDSGSRAYEDQAEAVALQRLLPASGDFLLELGAGAGRNTPRYSNFKKILLLDYSFTQLQQARERLGNSTRFTYVAANVYHLPFRAGRFDTATMIRVLHHIADVPRCLGEIRRTLRPDAVFVLEFANKQNLKAMLRYAARRQSWSPFDREPVEFVPLNFDFHPDFVRDALNRAGFELQRQLTVSHFRMGLFKKFIPTELLVKMDAMAQLTGDWWQLTPSVFVRSKTVGGAAETQNEDKGLFQCPACASPELEPSSEALHCQSCGREWAIRDGIYDFRHS